MREDRDDVVRHQNERQRNGREQDATQEEQKANDHDGVIISLTGVLLYYSRI